MFCGDMSCYFRDDYYHGTVPEIAEELFKVLNSLILKAPQVRALFYADIANLKIRQISQKVISLL